MQIFLNLVHKIGTTSERVRLARFLLWKFLSIGVGMEKSVATG